MSIRGSESAFRGAGASSLALGIAPRPGRQEDSTSVQLATHCIQLKDHQNSRAVIVSVAHQRPDC